ncbi:MAG TPA: hypothetical protein VIL37_19855 [Natronosporangium sp.]
MPIHRSGRSALVGQWLRSTVDYLVATGPFWKAEERAGLTRTVPDGVPALWVVIDAPVSVTLPCAQADPDRGGPGTPDSTTAHTAAPGDHPGRPDRRRSRP